MAKGLGKAPEKDEDHHSQDHEVGMLRQAVADHDWGIDHLLTSVQVGKSNISLSVDYNRKLRGEGRGLLHCVCQVVGSMVGRFLVVRTSGCNTGVRSVGLTYHNTTRGPSSGQDPKNIPSLLHRHIFSPLGYTTLLQFDWD